jgi:starch-binding outer membrane protein, SusD/RagB family
MKFNQISKFFLLGGLIAVSIAACTDLKVKEADSVVITTTGGMLDADAGAILASSYNDLGTYTDQANIYALYEQVTDEMIPPTRGVDWGDNGVWRTLHAHTWDATHSWVLNSWNDLNSRVFTCTQGLAATKPAPTPLQTAELKFLRAFNMYHVMDLFGKVPFRNVGEDASVNPRVNTRSEAFDFIEKDILDALPLLPAGGPATDNSKATKAAANTLLARLYLNKAVYKSTDPGSGTFTFDAADMQKVIDACDQVTTAGFDLDADYFNNFTANGASEKIFTSPSGSPQNRYFMTLHYSQNPSGWNGFTTLADFYGKFADGDQRKGQAAKKDGSDFSGIGKGFLVGAQFKDNGEVLIDSRSQKPLSFTSDVPLSGAATEKGIRAIKYHPADKGKYILFRYGDVVTMKAEAQMRKNDVGALATINALRAKRGATALGALTANDMLDERGREMYWEGVRRIDLIRFGKFADTWSEKSVTEKFRALYPIPQRALDSNPNLEQNEGYPK